MFTAFTPEKKNALQKFIHLQRPSKMTKFHSVRGFTKNHGDGRKSRHMTKITVKAHGDRIYVIILEL